MNTELLVTQIKVQSLTDNIMRLIVNLVDCEENREALTDSIPFKELVKMYDVETVKEILQELDSEAYFDV